MRRYRYSMSMSSVALAILLLMAACTPASPFRATEAAQEPPVRIIAPADGSTVLLGDTIAIRATADDERGIAGMQLWVDNRPAGNMVTPSATVTQFTQDLLWAPATVDRHIIKVIVLNNAGVQLESRPITLYVSSDASIRSTAIAVQLATATPDPFAPPTPIPSPYTPPPPFTPTPTRPTATATSTRPPITPPPTRCFDNAMFVADMTVPDGSQFNKGESFDKTWRLYNTGNCSWDARYRWVFVDGSQLNAPNTVALPKVVAPRDILDITVRMVAPNAAGTYRSRWQLRGPEGQNFGPIVQALIEVRPGVGDPPVITRFEVVPNTISQGQSATIYWEYINGTFARLTPGGEGGVAPIGSLVVSPPATTSYRLVVSNGAGTAERTVNLFVQAGPVPPLPPASPTNLTIVAIRPGGFDFTWTDASFDEQGFRLYNADTRQVMATFAPNVVGGAVGGLACGTPYRFYIVAFNQGAESWPSNTVQATTSACGG